MESLVAELLSQHDVEKTASARFGSKGTLSSGLLQHLPAKLQTAEGIGFDQMIMSFTSIHTSTITGMIVLLDLAAWPGYSVGAQNTKNDNLWV